jgi:hypothetical protein
VPLSKRQLIAILASVIWFIQIPLGANAASVTASNGAIFSVSKVSNIKMGEKLNISGARFDETVGIYIELCKIVKPGVRPSVCGGGADKTGTTGSSVWISSNPPQYGIGLAKPYQPGGRFSVSIKVSPIIGKSDCRKTSCAVYVRADHTRGDDRTFDQFIPIQFSK